MTDTPPLSLDDRLLLPPGTAAILWDLDGTLVNSLGLDLEVCGHILSAHAGRPVIVPEPVLREGFALSGSDFWAFLFKSLAVNAPADVIEAAHEEWLAERLVRAFPVNEGIPEILSAARAAGLRQAVVSNNPQEEVVQDPRQQRPPRPFRRGGRQRRLRPRQEAGARQLPVRGQRARPGAGRMRRRRGLRARPARRPRLRGVCRGGCHGGGAPRRRSRSSGLADACYARFARRS